MVAAGSNLIKAASIAELLEAITDAAPSHFQTAVMGVMQASPGGQPGPNFLTQVRHGDYAPRAVVGCVFE